VRQQAVVHGDMFTAVADQQTGAVGALAVAAAVESFADDRPGDRDVVGAVPGADGFVFPPARRNVIEHHMVGAANIGVLTENGDGVIVGRISVAFTARPHAKVLEQDIVRADQDPGVLDADSTPGRRLTRPP